MVTKETKGYTKTNIDAVDIFKALKGNPNCPNCLSGNVVRVADHSSHGYNGYVCADCNTKWGN